MLGIYIRTWLRGQYIGEDAIHNRYYRLKGFKGPWQDEPRWVIYKGIPEASKVPATWHSWLHHATRYPTTLNNTLYAWERPHRPNLTGTPFALRHTPRPHTTYHSWAPAGHHIKSQARQR